jgi:hypothetical protein
MKPATLMGLACAVATVLAALGGASEQIGKDGKDKKSDKPEVNIVLRVTRKIVSDITTKKVQRTTPVNLCVLGYQVTGLAHTTGTATLIFDEQPESGAFDIVLRGTSVSQSVVDSPPVQVFGSGRLDFILRKRVTFDGLKFASKPSQIQSRFCSTIDGIATPPGLFGLLVELIAMPKIKRQEPIFAEAAYEDGKAKLIAAFDEEVDKSLKDLNEVSPLEKTVNTLFPETKDWILYPSTTPTHLLIGIGPKDRKLPTLPVTDKTDAPIELWIRSKAETFAMVMVLKLWKDANKQLEEMLPGEIGKSLPLKESFQYLNVKEWFVIQIGKQAKEAPKESQPRGPEMLGKSGRVLFAEDRLPAVAVLPDSMVWRPMRPATSAATERADGEDNSITIVWRPVVTRGPPLAAPDSHLGPKTTGGP